MKLDAARSLELGQRFCAELHAHVVARLPMWALHERPNDYPEGYVLRFTISLPRPIITRVCVMGPTREAVEAYLPPGLVFLPRVDDDEPHIVGVWL